MYTMLIIPFHSIQRNYLDVIEAAHDEAASYNATSGSSISRAYRGKPTGTSSSNATMWTTKNVSMTACGHPVRNNTEVVSIAGVAGGILAFIAFILRIIARMKCCGGEFGVDDWVMAVTMLLTIALSSLSVVLADTGLGKDIWTLPFNNITRILKIYFFDECLYLSILPLTKISILFFYLRVFPKRSFRTAVYAVIGLNVCYMIAFVLISVFQCRPLNGAWLHWDGEHQYQCNNINAQGWAAAIFNMALDFVVMIMPLRELYHLQLSLRKKLLVMFMFSLGIFVTLVSILRLESLIHFASTDNLTWDYVQVGYWSTIEVHVGIICACLPAIRSLLTRICPNIFGDTRAQTGSSRSGGVSSRLESAVQKMDNSSHLDLRGSR
ncbi:hypothetical protein BDV26DRAFT_305352 [Aspergillus bertholletiae]|uniref:Rhodopsin domain-containing protein n=1 Tax=Aspergillus bertholletiae TaxID=1226010 RepID=A0A5N7B691_9EURO|nr:hypothetical protein BDV26DRAFT_305352 [Aspergillus bertholletiae]